MKTGFPASSITKAQLGEQAEERRKQQKAHENKELNSRHPPVSSTASDDSESSTGSNKNSLSGMNKKHVTFGQNDHLLMMSNLNPNINFNEEINNNDPTSPEVRVTRAGLKVCVFKPVQKVC